MPTNDTPAQRQDESFAGTDFAALFPSLARWTYVNHAAISPWPQPVHDAVNRFAAANLLDGPDSFPDWLRNEALLRERYAWLIQAAGAAEISLVQNTTEGVAIVANGLDWQAGDNIVTVQGEFPTNHMAWAALEARGVELRTVDIHGAGSAEQALIDAMDRRTRVLTVSAVQWIDGFRLQLGPLGRACRSRGTLFFVDAIQQLGALRIDVEQDAIDCLAAGGHKWQMAPEGLGLFYCRSTWRERLRPFKLGWRMLDEPFAFSTPNRPLASGGQRFEPGTPNTSGQFALAAALGLQAQFSPAWIEARVLANTARLMAGVRTIRGLRLASAESEKRRSGIVAVAPRKGTAAELAARLKAVGVVAIARGDVLRLSPHFYQDATVIDKVLEALESNV